MSYSILTILLLLEVLLVIGGMLLYWFFNRRRHNKGSKTREQAHRDRLLAFLDFEINRMQKILEEMAEGDSHRPPIEKRLSLFMSERNILGEIQLSGKLDNYAALIEKYYGNADINRAPEFNKLQDAITQYQQRIANLEKFRTLFFRNQDELEDAVKRIADLMYRLKEEQNTEQEMANLVKMLEQEKTRLRSELKIADHELEAIMSNIGLFHDTNVDCNLPDKAEVDEVVRHLRDVEEENEFLTVQIQHLLKNEVENTAQLQAKIDDLTGQLAGQAERYDALDAKFVEMEARYLKLVG